MTKQKLRVAAYAVCVEDGKLLLARWVGPEGKKWTMPGGGVDHGEDPYDAAIREVEEETGYTIEIDCLLGIDSARRHYREYSRRWDRETDLHLLRVLYRVRVVGGELRHETEGSTDQAAWVELDRVKDLTRTSLVDTALAYDDARPPQGRIAGGRTSRA